MSMALLEAEVKRLISKVSVYGLETVWKQNEFSEILPFPKPLSLSVLRGLASHEGATGMACRELSLPYNPGVPVEDYLETLFGRLFVNKAAEKCLNSDSTKRSFIKTFSASLKLEKENRIFYHEFPGILTTLEDYYGKQRQADVLNLSDNDLDKKIMELNRGLNDHYRFVVKAGILAVMNLENIESISGKDHAADLISVDVETIIKDNMEAGFIFDYRKKDLPQFHMFSSTIEYELACPRFTETGGSSPYQAVPARAYKARTLPMNRKTRDSILSFKIYESLKVIYKTLLLREIHLLRMALIEAGRRTGYGEDIFYLTLEEIPSVWESNLSQEITERKEKEAAFQNLDIPVVVTPSDLDNIIIGNSKQEPHALKGISVTGFEFGGKALIYRGDSDLDKADYNTIIVSRYASPNLVMAFTKVRGIITETGGLLSHLAIVAREQGFPIILQAKDSTMLIKNGDTVTVDENGNIFLR